MGQPNLESSCPYGILGVDRNATLKHIKSSYRKLALIYHPDKLPPNASDAEKKVAHTNFAAIGSAYELLSDERRRREYDFESSQHQRNGDNHSRRQQQQYQQQGGNHDDLFDGMMSGGMFSDPFFASSFGRRSHFQFTDPFELFERFFEEEMMGTHHHNHSNRSSSGRGGGSSFHSHSSSSSSSPFSDPFFSSSMGSMGGGFFGNANQMSRSHFGMADSLMSQMSMFGGHNQQQQQQFMNGSNGGGHSSYSFTSSSSSSGFGGGQSISTSTRTTIVNGAKKTVTERTVVHPDGRVERYVDSSEQDSGRPALESNDRRRLR